MASQPRSRPRKGVRLPEQETPAEELPAAPERVSVPDDPEKTDPRVKAHTVVIAGLPITLGVIIH